MTILQQASVKALKLSSVLQERIAIPLSDSFSFREEVFETR